MVKILNRDESSRLMACHYRQAGNNTDDVEARYIMYDRVTVESRSARHDILH